jgi:hypothetical protein
MPTRSEGTTIEAKVAQLETGQESLSRSLESLTRDVHELTGVVRQLASDVVKAGAPRQPNYIGIVGVAVSVGALVLALGGAVLIPLNNSVVEIKNTLRDEMLQCHKQMDSIAGDIHEHEKLTLHPTGQAIVSKMGSDLIALDVKLQKETELAATAIKNETRLSAEALKSEISGLDQRLQTEIKLYEARDAARLDKLETFQQRRVQMEENELSLRKQRDWNVIDAAARALNQGGRGGPPPAPPQAK